MVESGNALVATVAVLDPQRLVGLAYSAVALYVAYFFLDRVVAVYWQHLDFNLFLLFISIQLCLSFSLEFLPVDCTVLLMLSDDR